MLNECIEFHDSDILQVTVTDSNSMVIRMKAYIHRSTGAPGIDPGSGWVQNVELNIKELYSYGGLPITITCILSGLLIIADRAYLNQIPIPLSTNSHIFYSVILDNGSSFSVDGKGAILTLLGEARYVEEFSGSNAK